MPLSFRQLGNTFIAGPNINIYPSGNSYAISGSGSGSTTGIQTITTLGNGQFSIASSVTNNNLVYKTLSGTSDFGIIDNNLGLLTFTTSTSSSVIISGTNFGTGTGIFCGLTTTVSSNDTMLFANLSGGPNFLVGLNDDNEIFLDRVGQTIATSFRNEGGGAKILSSITATRNLVARTLSGANGFNIITASTVVSIRPTNTFASRVYITDSTNTLTTNSNFGQSLANGNISIGGGVSTTSRLLILAGSATQSQLRLTKSSFDVTSPTDGDIWYITTGNTLKFYKGSIKTDFLFRNLNYFLTGITNSKILLMDSGGTLTSKNVVDFGIFNTVSSLTISNTASETSIISSQLVTGNTKILLSSSDLINPQLVVGKKFRFNAKGIFSFLNFAQATFKVKLGSTIISSGVTNSSSSVETVTNAYFEIDTTFTIRTTGATGTAIGSGKIISDQSLLDVIIPSRLFVALASTGENTINTTSDQIFDVTIQFDTADSGNSITIYESTLEYLN